MAGRDGKQIAFEIETGKSDAIANVRKCLDAGLNRVVVVATSVLGRDKLSNALQRNNRTELLSMRSERAEKLLKLRQNFCSIGLVASRSVSVKRIWEISIDDYLTLFYL